MAQKTLPIYVYSASEMSASGKSNYYSLSNGTAFVNYVTSNVPPYSVIDSAMWSIYLKKSSSLYTANYSWGIMNGSTIIKTVASGGTLTTSYVQYKKEFKDYICSGTYDAGKINNDLCEKISCNLTSTYSSQKYYCKDRGMGYTITLPTIKAQAGTGGYVEGGDVTKDIDMDTTFTCVAVAKTGYKFVCWRESKGAVLDDTNATKTFTVDSLNETNTVYTAIFEPIPVTLTVSVEPPEAGTATGGGTYLFNEIAHLSVTPNEGYEFIQWVTDTGSFLFDGLEFNLTMSNNFHAIAVFEKSGINNMYTDNSKPLKAYVDKQIVKAIYIDKIKVYG